MLLHAATPVLRGDMPRLQRCTAITTGSEASPSSSSSTSKTAAAATATGSCKRDHTEAAVDDLEAEEEVLDNLLPKTIKRSKPFKYVYEKEIVMYAYFKVRPVLFASLHPRARESSAFD